MPPARRPSRPAPKARKSGPISGRAPAKPRNIGPLTIAVIGLPVLIIVFAVIALTKERGPDVIVLTDEEAWQKEAQKLNSEAGEVERQFKQAQTNAEQVRLADLADEKLGRALELYEKIKKNHIQPGTEDELEQGYQWIDNDMSQIGKRRYDILKERPHKR